MNDIFNKYGYLYTNKELEQIITKEKVELPKEQAVSESKSEFGKADEAVFSHLKTEKLEESVEYYAKLLDQINNNPFSKK